MTLDEFNKNLFSYRNKTSQPTKLTPEQQKYLEQQRNNPVGDITKSEDTYNPHAAAIGNGFFDLLRNNLYTASAVAGQAGQGVENIRTGERWNKAYEDILANAEAEGNTLLANSMVTPEERRRITGSLSKEEAQRRAEQAGAQWERPLFNTANSIPELQANRDASGSMEQFALDVERNTPQLLQGLAGPLASTALMASEIAGADYADLRRKNYSQDAALGAGVIDAAAQTPMESFSAGKVTRGLRNVLAGKKSLAYQSLLDKNHKLTPEGKSKLKEWVGTILTEAGTEAVQEYPGAMVEDIAASIEKGTLVNDLGNIVHKYTVGEESEEALQNALYSGLLGGVMGGAVHGAGTVAEITARKLAGNPNPTSTDIAKAVSEAREEVAPEEEANGNVPQNQDNNQSYNAEDIHPVANYGMDFFRNKGTSDIVAAGIMGNLAQESGYDSTIENSIGAYGLAQWLDTRRDALVSFSEENGLDPSSVDAQLEFIWHEIQQEGTPEHEAYLQMQQAQSPEEAAVIFRKLYERPGEEEANDEARTAEARKVYNGARAWLENKRDTMDIQTEADEGLYGIINKILTESDEEQLVAQARALGFKEQQEESLNRQREQITQAIKEERNDIPKTPQVERMAQGRVEAPHIEPPQANIQPIQPVAGMETVERNRTAPHIGKIKSNKTNYNSRGNYNGRLGAPQNKLVESPIKQGQSAPILQQGENQNAENLQTQTTQRRENRKNLNENTEPQQTQTAESQTAPQNSQGNEVTPILAPSNQGTADIAQNVPKTVSNGQSELSNKVNGDAFIKATEGNTGAVLDESKPTGLISEKEREVLDKDPTISFYKKTMDTIVKNATSRNRKETAKKLEGATKAGFDRLEVRKNKGEISEETYGRLQMRANEILAETQAKLNKNIDNETPKKEEQEKENKSAKKATKSSGDKIKAAFGMGKGMPSIFNTNAVEEIMKHKVARDIVSKMPKAEEPKTAKKRTKPTAEKEAATEKTQKKSAKDFLKEHIIIDTGNTIPKAKADEAKQEPKEVAREETKAEQEKPKKAEVQEKADTQDETLEKKSDNTHGTEQVKNDIIKEDNSDVSIKEETNDVPERGEGLGGAVGMGRPRTGESEGKEPAETTGSDSKDEGGDSGRKLREESSGNARADERENEGSVSVATGEGTGNGRDDSTGNESGRVAPSVKVEKVEEDIAKGKVKDARDTSGNDYTPAKVTTENRSPKKRCEANIDAIALLKKLESENRKATPTEQEILAGYSGWGGLSFAFNEHSAEYSPETNQKLQNLLTESEYAEAKSEIVSAFYTPPFVIQAMWKLAKRLGFNGGRVLDPSCGVANFFTYMPTDMKGNSTALQGIDKSPIPARIAAQLFQSQKYKIDNSSYEKFARGDNFYDIAITNVPFSSSIRPTDKAVKGSYNLHDYYFAKSLQKVRPGGLIIFMTTHSTMDNSDSARIRRELSLKTELLGAIRLPSNLFDKAGAGVISDIIVLRKLNEGEGVHTESWSNYAKKKNENGFEISDTDTWKAADELGVWERVNNYWNEHPENIIGKVEIGKGRYGGNVAVVKTENEAETQKLLGEAINRFAENVYQPRTSKPLNTVKRVKEILNPSQRTVGDIFKNDDGEWAKVVFDGDSGKMVEESYPTTKQTQVGAFMELNKAQNDLMLAEVTPESTDKELDEKRKALNTAYDKYLAKYGALNEKATLNLTSEFPQVGRMLALENYTPPANKKRNAKGTVEKADIFTKRVLYPEGLNAKVETAEDALIASIQKYGRVDLEYMGNLLGESQDNLVSQLSEKIIKDPNEERYVLVDEYLSGNVRAKLLIAESATETDPDMQRNVELLKKVIPKDVELADISIPLGSPIVTQEETQDFIDHMLGQRNAVVVKFNPVAGVWDVKKGSRSWLTHQTEYIDYGVYIDSGNCKGVTDFIEACLNTTDISNWTMFKSTEKDSTEMRKAREEAQQQAQLVREKIDREFKQWIESDSEVSARVKEAYNLKFNAFAPRKYDGSILSVNTTKHTPYAHQLNGAFRAIMSKAALLNHCVGSGKSLTMMIAGMEMKRMGLANKIVYALPKNVVKQFEKEFYEDFPTAKILVLSSATLPRAPRTITYDLVPRLAPDGKTQLVDAEGIPIYDEKPVTKEEEARRRAILARRNATLQKIKTNDWDAILVSHNTFENIPVSYNTLIDFYEKEIKRYEDALEQEEFEKERSNRKGRTARRIQELLIKYRAMLEEALEGKDRYDVGEDTFETLGIDQIFVDESDLFKNLGFLTSLSQVKGISTSGSGRAMDMFMKTQYLLHEPSAHGVTFATGTPISNSISEAYTLCRYLAPDELERLGCNSFDQFAKMFVNIAPAEEPKLDGSGYQYKTKVVGIRNAPECFRIINQFMDTKTVEDLPYIKERLPKAKRTTVTVKEPAALSKFKDGLKDRIAGFKGKFGKELPTIESRSRASIENFKKTGQYLRVRDGYLKVAQDYKDITLCPYIYDSTLTGEEAFGRVWACADKVAEVYKKTTGKNGTQVIFCDSSTPKRGEWSVYEEVKQRLVAQGVPENEIAFVHDAGNNETKRQEIFNAVRDGRIRVLIGSTEKMGAGTNMQDKLVALHHLDAPWRPRDIEQREGRILRNGNENKEVAIFTYVTEGSYDMNLYNLLATKQAVFSQILHGSEDVRETDTEGVDNNNFAEIEKLANNDPTQVMYLEKQQQLRRLEAEKAGDVAAKAHATAVVNSYDEKIQRDKKALNDYTKDVAEAERIGEKFTIQIGNKVYTNRAEAGEAFKKELEGIVKKLATEYSIEITSGRFQSLEMAVYNVHPIHIAKIGAFDISVGITRYFANNHDVRNTQIVMKGANQYEHLTVSAVGAWNAVHSLPATAKETAEAKLIADQKELEQAQKTLDRTFDKNDEIEKLKKEVADLRDAINKSEGQKLSAESTATEAFVKSAQAVYEQDLTDREKGLIAFGRKMGVTISFFKGDSRLHGWQKGNAIFINRNSAKDLNQVFWHESFHWLKRNNQKLYESLEKAVLQNDDIAAQVKAWQKKTGRNNLTEEETIEEMLADAMLDASTRGKFFEKLGVTHPTLAQKLIKWIKNTYRDLVNQFRHTKGFKPEAGLTNTQINRMSTALDNMALKLVAGNGNKLFSKDANGNLKENTVSDAQYADGVKYLVTNKDLRATDRIKVVSLIDNVNSQETLAERKERVSMSLKGKSFKIKGRNMSLYAGGREDREHFAAGSNGGLYALSKVTILSNDKNIKNVVKNSVYIEEEKNYHAPNSPKHFAQFYAAVRIGNDFYRVRISAIKKADGTYVVDSAKLYHLSEKGKLPVSAIKNETGDVARSPELGNDNLPTSSRFFTISIADLMDGVNDRNKKPYVINGELQFEPKVLAEIQAEERAKETKGKEQDTAEKFSIDLSDLSEGKVFSDATKNAIASRIQKKMEIAKDSDFKHYMGKFLPKQPQATSRVRYDKDYNQKKRETASNYLNYGVLAWLRSPSRLKNPIINRIYTWAEQARRTQNKLYSKWTIAHKEILDLVQDAKDYAGYVDVLLTEDSDKRVFSDGELRSLGYSDKVIEAHKKVRALLKEIREEVAKIYLAEHVETKNFKSKAEADQWAANPMFKDVTITAMQKENGLVWQVKYTTPQYVERTDNVSTAMLNDMKSNPDIHILEYSSMTDETDFSVTHNVRYLKTQRSLADLDQYIPHFFHEFLVIEVVDGYRRVVGSGTTLNEAVEVANKLSQNTKGHLVIAPKGFAYEDATQALGIVGDKDLTNLSEMMKEDLEISLEEARNAVKGNSHHVFLSALQHRKGASGWETNMRWVIQHHISNTARYCALEPFKQFAMNLFERRFGSFGDTYSRKSVVAEFTQGFINSVLGTPSKAEEIVNAVLSCLPGLRDIPRPSRAVTSSVVGAMAVFKLGASPAAAFINLTQFINLQGYIGTDWTIKGMNAARKPSETDAKLLEELGTREETGLETVDVSEETELIAGRFEKELKLLKNAADKSMFLFTKAESFLRSSSILGAYHKALAEGKSEGAARAYALEVNRNVNFNYNVEDAPRLFRALQGSVVGDMFLQFKKYGLKELEVIVDMLANKDIPKSQKMIFFGEYFLLGGLFNSVPFQDMILALLGLALDEDDPEAEMKKWLMEFGEDNWAKRQLALLGMYGLGGTAGIDISQRVGFRSLVPEFDEPLGVTGSTIKQTANALMNGDPIGFSKSVSPAAGNVVGAIAGYNTDSKGRVSYVYKDPYERAMRALGFRTTGEALSVDKQRILNEDRSQREKQRKEAREAYFDNPSRENRSRLKELGYTDNQIKNLKPNDPTLERTERMRKSLTKKEKKEFSDILNW